MRSSARVGSVLAVALALVVPASAQDEPQKRTVAPGPHYRAGGFHRAMLGSSYRALWTTPVEAEVLDLATEAMESEIRLHLKGSQN